MKTFTDFLREADGQDLLDVKRTPVKIIKFKDGKKVIKKTCLLPGYKYDSDTNSCKRIPMSTQRKMKLGAKRRVRLMKSKMATTVRKRKKSMKIRQSRIS